jgi:hypothetical protein
MRIMPGGSFFSRWILGGLWIGVVSSICCLCPADAAAAEPPDAAAVGECPSLPPALSHEIAAWRGAAHAARAGAAADSAPVIGAGRRYGLALVPGQEVAVRIVPRRSTSQAGGFGGFVAFQSGPAGAYRVSLGDRAWVEVIADASGAAAQAAQSDVRLRCAGIAKNLSFELAAQTRYLLQLSGAERESVDVMVFPPAE